MKNFKELLTLIPFVLGIAILLNLFVFQGMQVVYPTPQYDDFCDREDKAIEQSIVLDRSGETTYTPEQTAEFANQCVENGGKYEEPRVLGELGYCDQDYTCRQEFEAAQADRALVMLFVLVIAGVVSILLSRQFKNKAVELGLSYGGLFMLVATLGQLWQVGSQVAQLVGIAVALVVLVYFVAKKTNFDL